MVKVGPNKEGIETSVETEGEETKSNVETEGEETERNKSYANIVQG